LNVIDSIGERPHFMDDCWCNPYMCEDCDLEHHRCVQLTIDDQPRMAVFTPPS
jgi:hypothetical protein